MARTEIDDDRALDALLATARQAPADPSPALLARVLADAEAVQAARSRPATPRTPRAPALATARAQGALRRVLDLLGGWGGVGGLVAAGLTGLWIGFSGTGLLGTASAGFWGGSVTDETAAFGAGEMLSLTLALEGEA